MTLSCVSNVKNKIILQTDEENSAFEAFPEGSNDKTADFITEKGKR